MAVKNTLIIFFLKIAKFFYPKASRQANQSFLIVSTTALGDTLWATPSIKKLRDTYPNSKIYVLTSITGLEVLKGNPHIDQIFPIFKPFLKNLYGCYKSLKRIHFEKIFIFHTSQRAVLPMCYLLSSDNIIGSTGINKGLDKLISTPLDFCYEHEIIRRLRIIGCLNPLEHLKMELFLEDYHQKAAKDFFAKKGINLSKKIIGFHPGSKDAFKRWPLKNFIQVANELKKDFDCIICISYGPFEESLAQEMLKKIPGAIGLDQNFSIRTLGALINLMDVFVTNDTGPMHVALAVKTKTVCLFCATDPNLCGPIDLTIAKVIQVNKTCTPCIKKKCINPFCMMQISPATVKNSIQKFLAT